MTLGVLILLLFGFLIFRVYAVWVDAQDQLNRADVERREAEREYNSKLWMADLRRTNPSLYKLIQDKKPNKDFK